MTTPDHNWPVIFLMAILYWLLLFPGGLILGLKRIDYRIVLGSILATVARIDELVGSTEGTQPQAVPTVPGGAPQDTIRN